MAKVIPTSVRLPVKLHKVATDHAKGEHRSLNALVIVALTEYLERRGRRMRPKAKPPAVSPGELTRENPWKMGADQ